MNDNETVYVIQGTNKHKTSYHDDTDACQSSKAAGQFEEMSVQEAESRGLDRCKWCAGEVDNSGADFSYQNLLKEKAEQYAAGDD